MVRDDVDLKALLVACDGAGLDAVIATLTTGKSHHNIKIEAVSDMMPFIRSMKQVVKFLEFAQQKFVKLMSAKMWMLGCVEQDGPFKMDVLVSFVRGVRALK